MSKSTLTCAACGKAMWSGKASKPQGEAHCGPCRRDGKAIEHGTQYAYRRHKCRCDTCKAAHNVRMREYNRMRKERDGASATSQSKRRAKGLDPTQPQQPCGYCGEPVAMNRGSEVAYHRACRNKVPSWRREGRESPRVEAFRSKIDRAAAGTSGGGRVWSSGSCEWCGKHFVGLGFTCSERCKTSRKFDARSVLTFNPSPRRRAEVYERDNHTCQICFMAVDETGDPWSDWYPSLDHVIPQSMMLIPDHSSENLRTAHRICNSYRSDGAFYTDDQVRDIVLQRFALTA